MTKAQEASLIEAAVDAAITGYNADREVLNAADRAHIAPHMRRAILAALRAMKEHGPTEAMLAAGFGQNTDAEREREIFNAMLEAAITEAQP